MKTNVKIARTLICLFIILVTGKVFSQNSNTTVNANKTDTSVREIQVSFLPFISFNGSPINSTVNLSLNILGGYVKEVRTLEIGSIINIDEKNAGKCQVAGVGNVVGGVSSGFQSAGVFNFAASQMGVQIGGVLNVVARDAGKCQIAGEANVVCGSFNGFQAAGVINVAKSLKGVQVAGVLNTVFKDAKSSQIAGVGNVTAGSFEGCQIGGVFNYATKVTGAQISGLLNVTTFMKGTQLSFMNI